MSEWTYRPLGELVHFRKGVKVELFEHERENAAPYLGASALDGSSPSQWASTTGAVIAKESDVLMLWDGERSGLVSGDLKGVVASTVACLSVKKGTYPAFLKHSLQAKFGWIQSRRTGTGVPHVPKDLASMLVLPVPSTLKEQEQIAEVLDALDNQIKLADTTLEKLQSTSYGLLVELMTKGVVTNRVGTSGPDLMWHDQPFALPHGWELQTINELLAPVHPALRSGPFGSALLKHELVSEGVPLLGIDNVHVNRFESKFERFVTHSKSSELARYLVRPNDVMITIMGTVGRACLVPTDIGPALSSKHVWTLTIDASRYSPYLVSRQLNHAPWAREHLRRDEQGGVMSAIRSDTLKSLVLPLPPRQEQHQIERILQTVDAKISAQAQILDKLRLLKSGLMSDLLTGSVRVHTGAKL